MESEVVQGISISRSVVPNSLQPHGLPPTRLLCLWDFPGKNAGVGCHFLLQGSSRPRDRTRVSCTASRFFTYWATRKPTWPYWIIFARLTSPQGYNFFKSNFILEQFTFNKNCQDHTEFPSTQISNFLLLLISYCHMVRLLQLKSQY